MEDFNKGTVSMLRLYRLPTASSMVSEDVRQTYALLEGTACGEANKFMNTTLFENLILSLIIFEVRINVR